MGASALRSLSAQDDVIGGQGGRRRPRRRTVIAGACIVAAVVAVPVLTDRSQPAEPLPVASTGEPPPVVAVDGSRNVLDRPTLGSLAEDLAFVEGVRALPWSDGQPEVLPDGSVIERMPDPVAEMRHVMFAGDVPGGRWAVVVGPPPDDMGSGGGPGTPELMTMVFRGPPGASPAQMTPDAYPNWVPADWTAAVLDPITGTLLVLPAPGDQVELSERPEIAADGSTSREYRLLDTTDGVAALHPWPLTGPEVTGPEVTEPQIPIDYPRGTPSPTGATAASWAAQRILAETGLLPTEVELAAQWVGPVPGDGVGEVAVVTATVPSGAILVDAQWTSPESADGSTMGGVCGRAVLPAGPPADQRVYALTCEIYDGTTGSPSATNLVVVAPRHVAAVRAYGRDQGFLSEYPAKEGIVVLPLHRETNRVEALTAAQVSLGRVDLLGYAESFGD